MDVLRCHEQDGVQHASVHLRHRYREDQQPGEHAGQGVDHSHHRVAQQEPDASTVATLGRNNRRKNSKSFHVSGVDVDFLTQ